MTTVPEIKKEISKLYKKSLEEGKNGRNSIEKPGSLPFSARNLGVRVGEYSTATLPLPISLYFHIFVEKEIIYLVQRKILYFM